jgi:tetratricopeptide (TPR) repeat protein
MKKIALLTLALVTASGIYAQKGVEDGSRYGHGEDSINVIKNISIYTEYYKTNNFKDAYEQGWKEVFNDAPWASVNTYNFGIKILRTLYNEAKAAKDEALMAQYSEDLFKLYEQRIKYLDQLNSIAQNKVTEAEIWGQYGHDYRSYNPKVSVSRAYELLRKAVDMGKGKTQYYVLNDLMAVSSQRFKNKKDNEEYRDALLQDYVDCANYIDEFIAMETNDKILEAAVEVKERIDNQFATSGAADCESLQNIYGPKIEDNKDNAEYLDKVIKLMTMFQCNSSDAFFAASEYAYQLDRTAKTAKNLGTLYLKQREDADKALEYYNQSIELDEDKTNMADTYYAIAYIYLSKKDYDRCRTALQKCLSNNPNKGDAYILMAQLYAIKYKWTDDNALNRCAFFAAIDKLEMAKKVDSRPEIAEKANNLIKEYKGQTENLIEDLFMLGYKAGDQIQIKGWINETTTIR